ncbi:transcriptional regulator [Terasakiella brassicae]|uniref:Transcriptional regulator n=1 Tax=Terasakiella brassicae TaxID=1634917 RepID=A0A917BT49_9PROT|nr:LysR family transcriptional regulator [Terasakiella brassicae]GGF57799.1 transcriptional regulator [Terasakiella brassicae]
MSLDPECLKAFVTVADCGSFTRAAQILNRTQAAVSQQIKKLELLLDARLFQRHSRAVSLSSHGHLLLGYAKRLLALQDEAIHAFREADTKCTVRLGTPDDYASSFMPTIINAFAHAHPNAEIEVRCDLSIDLLDSLNRHEIDLALITKQANNTTGEDVRVEPLVWVGAAGGMAYMRETLPLALFSSSDSKCMFRYGGLAILKETGRDYHIAYTSRNTSVVLAAVRADTAVAILARSSVPPDLTILDDQHGLPPLPEIRIALHRRTGERNRIIDDFGDHIVKTLSLD